MRLLSNRWVKAPVVHINIDTPYYTGEVTGLALANMICDLVIGNIKGAKKRHVDEVDERRQSTVIDQEASPD